ncbi:MAG: DUF1641 domain-containing protein [Halobacteriaceae archaeon]
MADLDEAVVDAIEENPAAVATLIERLDAVNELLDVLELGTAALDDEMVTTLSRRGSRVGELVDTASDPETVQGLEMLLRAVGEAGSVESPPDRVGALGLLKATRDPDVQRGLGLLIAVARATGAQLDESHEP